MIATQTDAHESSLDHALSDFTDLAQNEPQTQTVAAAALGDPFERAAARTRQSVKPDQGRQEGALTQVPEAIASGVAAVGAQMGKNIVEPIAGIPDFINHMMERDPSDDLTKEEVGGGLATAGLMSTFMSGRGFVTGSPAETPGPSLIDRSPSEMTLEEYRQLHRQLINDRFNQNLDRIRQREEHPREGEILDRDNHDFPNMSDSDREWQQILRTTRSPEGPFRDLEQVPFFNNLPEAQRYADWRTHVGFDEPATSLSEVNSRNIRIVAGEYEHFDPENPRSFNRTGAYPDLLEEVRNHLIEGEKQFQVYAPKGKITLERMGGDEGSAYQSFNINDEEGKNFGHIRASYLPSQKKIYIHWAGDLQFRNVGELGPTRVRSMLKQLRSIWPDAKKIEGYRVSGARQKSDKGPGKASMDLEPK